VLYVDKVDFLNTYVQLVLKLPISWMSNSEGALTLLSTKTLITVNTETDAVGRCARAYDASRPFGAYIIIYRANVLFLFTYMDHLPRIHFRWHFVVCVNRTVCDYFCTSVCISYEWSALEVSRSPLHQKVK